MYICEDCGHLREELVEHRRYDKVDGNSMMSGWITEVDDKCSCGGYYVEAVKCPLCGDWVAPDECEGVHEDCYKEACHDLEKVIKYAEQGESEDLFILLTEYVFDKEDVVQILLKQAKYEYKVPILKERIDKELENYTNDNIGDFANWIGENQ